MIEPFDQVTVRLQTTKSQNFRPVVRKILKLRSRGSVQLLRFR